jgi:hypothetical protein
VLRVSMAFCPLRGLSVGHRFALRQKRVGVMAAPAPGLTGWPTLGKKAGTKRYPCPSCLPIAIFPGSVPILLTVIFVGSLRRRNPDDHRAVAP